MATEQTGFDPFSIRDLLTLPTLVGDESSTWKLSPLERSLTPKSFSLDFPHREKLQSLQEDLFFLNLDDVSLPETDSITNPSSATDTESVGPLCDGAQPETEEVENIWTFPDVVYGNRTDGLLSWDNFVGNHCTGRSPAYLSEAPGGIFELALCRSSRKDDQLVLKHPQPEFLYFSLRELSLGRESVFFSYDRTKMTFATRFEAHTIQDISAETLSSLTADFLRLGNDMRTLHSFAKHNLASSQQPVRVALSAAIAVVLHALENDLRLSGSQARSSLQLQEAIRKPGIILSSLRTLTEQCPEDALEMAPFVRLCATLSDKYQWLCEILHQVVARSASSQIDAIGYSVGLGASTVSTGNLKSDPVSIRNLLAEEVTEILTESQEALALLRDTCPDHQLLICSDSSHANLQWGYSWAAIAKLQTKAEEYEVGLKQAILHLRERPNPVLLDAEPHLPHGSSGSAEEQLRTWVITPGDLDLDNAAGPQTFLANEVASSQDKLFQAVSVAMSGTREQAFDLQPDLEHSMSLSMMPMLAAQHRLLAYSILSLLFEVHNVQAHFLIQYRFQLLGDGLFASRLSRALFDSAEVSGEGRRRNGARTGLRLQSRGKWPPASSELRLVLLGILSDSVLNQNAEVSKNSKSNADPPDESISLHEALSFAIRDLSDEDLEKCRDVDTVHALDFLALQYKPPTVLLEAVITPQSLKSYDVIFIHLLRVLRVKTATQELVRDVTTVSRWRESLVTVRTHKIRLELHHFIFNLADWVQNIVIARKWAVFAAILGRVGKCLGGQDYNGVLEVGKGFGFIRSLHERLIDDIARTLFLTKKHQGVNATLERILNIVLRLARHIRMDSSSDTENENNTMIRQLHHSFQKEVKGFLVYLHSNLSGTQGDINQLALRLDMFGYYTDKG
jgi:hypothetical protein